MVNKYIGEFVYVTKSDKFTKFVIGNIYSVICTNFVDKTGGHYRFEQGGVPIIESYYIENLNDFFITLESYREIKLDNLLESSDV